MKAAKTKFTGTLSGTGDNRSVIAYANGKRIYAWSITTDKLAARLIACIEAGKAFEWTYFEADQTEIIASGGRRTFVSSPARWVWTAKILGRTMNADLRRLGF